MIKVFVSHASNEDEAQTRFVDDLVARLKQQFEIFYDRETIASGAPWRKRILAGLGAANAGLVILSQRALNPAFPWVHTEATVMRWKQLTQDGQSDFPLLILFYGQHSKAQFDNDPKWDPLQFSEINFVRDNTELVFSGERCSDAVVSDIATQLEKASCTDLFGFDGFAQDLRHELNDAIRSRGAMDHQGFEGLFENLVTNELTALNELIKQSPRSYRREPMAYVLDALAPLWVPHEACHYLAQTLDVNCVNRSFAIYVSEDEQFAVDCYLAQPKWMVYGNGWFNIRLSDVEQEISTDSILNDINQQLQQIIGKRQSPKWTTTDAQANLHEALEFGSPVFVLIPEHLALCSHPNVLEFIRQNWPSLNQLLLLNPGTCAPEDCQVLSSQSLEQQPANLHHYTQLMINRHCS